ncbi:MAG: copy number control protein [Gammaproteobacteria bacterium]|nr:copy number control protein [Gammaproteobacteria bacterium]
MTKKMTHKLNIDTSSHITISVPQTLKNEFKAKVASEGKTVKEVIHQLMKEYIKKAS